jgi:peptide/nickel transport system substrate-binding protein
MKFKAPLFALALVAAGTFFAFRATCTESEATTLNQLLSLDPPTLNNLVRSDNRSRGICEGYLMPPLLVIDPETLEPKPQLAAGMPEISADRLVYTWTLRGDASWEDGTPVTTKDVDLGFRLAKDPATTAGAARAVVDDVKSLDVVDAHTFRVTFGAPWFRAMIEFGTNFRLVPAHRLAGVEPAKLDKHPIGRQPIAYGPYRLKSWVADREIVLVRNEKWYGARPAFDVVRFRIVKDDAAYPRLLRQKQLDWATLSADDWKKCSADPDFARDFQMFEYYLPQSYFFAWNCSRPLFADARVRRALSHAIRRQEIVDTVLGGHGRPALGPFGSMDPACASDLPAPAFDLDAAKKLLAEAGWSDSNGDGILDKDGKKFEFRMLYSSSSSLYSAILTTFKGDLEKIGVVCELQSTDWNPFLQKLDARDYDASMALWNAQAADDDPSRLLRSTYANSGQNYAAFASPRVDELLDRARGEFDRTKRIALYRELQQVLNEEQPYAFLVVPEILLAVSRRFDGVKLHPVGIRPLEWTLASARAR